MYLSNPIIKLRFTDTMNSDLFHVIIFSYNTNSFQDQYLVDLNKSIFFSSSKNILFPENKYPKKSPWAPQKQLLSFPLNLQYAAFLLVLFYK